MISLTRVSTVREKCWGGYEANGDQHISLSILGGSPGVEVSVNDSGSVVEAARNRVALQPLGSLWEQLQHLQEGGEQLPANPYISLLSIDRFKLQLSSRLSSKVFKELYLYRRDPNSIIVPIPIQVPQCGMP